MRAQARRKVVDKIAAAVMLQTWLDTPAPTCDDPESGEHVKSTLDPLLPRGAGRPRSRPALDWPPDPWDDPDQTGTVERLRRADHARSSGSSTRRWCSASP